MKHLLLFILILVVSCQNATNDNNSSYSEQMKAYRADLNKKMAKKSSPLEASDKKNFAGLNFLGLDTNWKFNAKFELLFSQEVFKMKTNTDRTPVYRKFGKITFTYQSKEYRLFAYQEVEDKGNMLFIPFTDLSNGSETYSTGRYLDIAIPEGNSVVLDFNKCYNPYCAYNKKYSCPIPPSENRLNIRILAGEASYHH